MESLYWEHEDGRKAIRINFDSDSKAVLGFNLMGIRYRHEVCEKWLKEGIHIEEMLPLLSLANFDPEFYDCHEDQVIQLYNSKYGRDIQLKSSRGLSGVLSYLKKKIRA